MISGALSLLSSASQIFGVDAEGAVITAEDSISQAQGLPTSTPPQPRVLVADSEVN